MRRSLTLTVLVAAALWGVLAATARAAPEMGKMVCVDCHEDQWKAMEHTPHGRTGFAKLSDDGCITCHKGADKHAENPDDDEIRSKIGLTGLASSEVAERCQQCHDGAKQFEWPGGRHAARGLSCISCHSVHAAKSESKQLVKKSTMETCFQCHKDVRAETWKTSHHPIREGRITCTDCHNPHGSPWEKMLNASSVNEQCYSCHTEKRGPFLWEHAPVRESCMNCHQPHGSNHLKLQRTSVPYLCQQCHANTRHPGTLYDASAIAGESKASNREFNRSCVNCHAAIHGSNHPSGPYLGR